MVVEPLKKFAVGDMPPSPTTSNPISSHSNTHKKPTRHHYKRRSSGRIHVTKLAPMAKAHTQQQSATEGDENTDNDDDGNFEDVDQQTQRHQQHVPRKPMKRTHSNKSIHRLSSNDPHRKVNLSGFTMTLKPEAPSSSSQNTTHTSPPLTPADQQFQQKQQDLSTLTKESIYATNRDNIDSATCTMASPRTEHSTRKKNPSFHVSHQATAAPIANTLNATANTLVTPDKPALANLTIPNNNNNNSTIISIATTSSTATSRVSKKKHLCSRFIRQAASDDQHHHLATDEFFSTDDMIRNTVDLFIFGALEKEYQYIQTYQDPMEASLTRCMKQRQTASRPSTQSQLQRLAQRGAQQRTFSSSILPTMSTLASTPAVDFTPLPSSYHLDKRQQSTEHHPLARQRHRRLQAAYASSTHHHHHHHHHRHHSSSITTTTTSSEINKQSISRWSAGALLDRVFYGAS